MANWTSPGPPLVSICCATFNHANYLKDALHSFLCQETDFPFEIIIRDDASTDGTTEIVRDYASRYPSIVRAAIESVNQFSRGIRPMHVWPDLARGKYIAFCEGDDFWLDPHKLQLQIDLLDAHPEAVMSVAGTNVYKQSRENLEFMANYSGNRKVLQTFDDIKHQYFHTSTYVVRAGVFKEVVKKYFTGHFVLGDNGLRFILISKGPFVLLPKVVSAYRITGEGIWTSRTDDEKLKWEFASTRTLFELLSGEHKSHQGERLYSLLRTASRRSFDRHRFVEGARLLPQILHYGIKYRLAAYAKQKLLAYWQS